MGNRPGYGTGMANWSFLSKVPQAKEGHNLEMVTDPHGFCYERTRLRQRRQTIDHVERCRRQNSVGESQGDTKRSRKEVVGSSEEEIDARQGRAERVCQKSTRPK